MLWGRRDLGNPHRYIRVMQSGERTPYVDTFFRELSPVWLNYVAALNGVAPRPLDGAFTYMELGCGFGQTVTVNAAALPRGEFHACDIDEAHIAAARRYAAAAGVHNVALHHSSFDALFDLELPMFDFVVLHGVYSWVDDEAKRTIRRFIDRSLKPGGLVYASYNCLPGWAVELPLRRLFAELASRRGCNVRDRVTCAVQLLRRLEEGRLGYFATHPVARSATRAYGNAPAEYLAHELLGESWQALYSVDVADDMREASLCYVGSATLADNHSELVMSIDAARSIAELETPRQRRLAEDFAANRYFRRDVFVREPAPDPDAAHLGRTVIGSISPERIGTAARVPRGQVTFADAFATELRGLLQRGSMTVADIVLALGNRSRDAGEIVRNLTYLLAAGVLVPFARALPHGRLLDETSMRALAYAVRHRVPRAVPSEALGNGFEVQPDDAYRLLGSVTPRHGHGGV